MVGDAAPAELAGTAEKSEAGFTTETEGTERTEFISHRARRERKARWFYPIERRPDGIKGASLRGKEGSHAGFTEVRKKANYGS